MFRCPHVQPLCHPPNQIFVILLASFLLSSCPISSCLHIQKVFSPGSLPLQCYAALLSNVLPCPCSIFWRPPVNILQCFWSMFPLPAAFLLHTIPLPVLFRLIFVVLINNISLYSSPLFGHPPARHPFTVYCTLNIVLLIIVGAIKGRINGVLNWHLTPKNDVFR